MNAGPPMNCLSRMMPSYRDVIVINEGGMGGGGGGGGEPAAE